MISSIRFPLLSLLLLFPFAACSTAPSTPTAQPSSSARFAPKGSPEAAQAQLKTNPDSGPANLEMARVLIQQNRLFPALNHILKAIEAMPTSPEPHLLLAHLMEVQGRTSDRAKALIDARAIDPTSVTDTTYREALLSGFKEAVSLKSSRTALQFASELRNLAPDALPLSSSEYLDLSISAIKEALNANDTPAAKALLQSLNTTNNPKLRLYAGTIHLNEQQYDAAIDDFTTYLIQGPRDQLITELTHIFDLVASSNDYSLFPKLVASVQSLIQDPSLLQETDLLLIASLPNRIAPQGEPLTPLQQAINRYLKHATPPNGTIPDSTFAKLVHIFADSDNSTLVPYIEQLARQHNSSGWTLAYALLGVQAQLLSQTKLEELLSNTARTSPLPDAPLHILKWSFDRRMFAFAARHANAYGQTLQDQRDYWVIITQLGLQFKYTERAKRGINRLLTFPVKPDENDIRMVSQLNQLGLSEEALKWSTKLRKQDPSNPKLLFAHANLLLDKKDAEKQLTALFDSFLSQHRLNDLPKGSLSLQIGEWLSNHHHTTIGILYLKQAADHGIPEATLSLIHSSIQAKDYTTAITYLDSLLRQPNLSVKLLSSIVPDFATPVLLQENQRLLEAIWSLDKPHFIFGAELAHVYEQQGLYRKAAAFLFDNLRLNPKNSFALRALIAYAKEITSDPITASNNNPALDAFQSEFTKLTYISPFDADLLEPVSELLTLDQIALSDQTKERIFEVLITANKLNTTNLIEWARKQYDEANYKQAVRIYESLPLDTSLSIDEQSNFASALVFVGRVKEGSDLAMQAVKSAEPNDQARLAISFADLLLSDPTAALESYAQPFLELAQQLELWPTDLLPVYRLSIAAYNRSNQHHRFKPITDWFIERSVNTGFSTEEAVIVVLSTISDSLTLEYLDTFIAQGKLVDPFKKGEILYDLARYDESDAAFQEVANDSSKPFSIWYQLGSYYIRKADFPRAIQAFSRAIDADPSEPQSWIQRGKLNLFSGNLDQGISDFEHVISNLDGNERAAVQVLLLEALKDSGFYGKQCETALTLFDQSSTYHSNLITNHLPCIIATGDPLRLTKLIDAAQNSGAETAQVASYMDSFMGDPAAAADLVAQALGRLSPDDIPILLLSGGNNLLSMGMYDQVQQAYRTLQDSDTDLSNSHNWLMGPTLLAMHANRTDDALRSLDKDRFLVHANTRILLRLGKSIDEIILYFKNALPPNPPATTFDWLEVDFSRNGHLEAFDRLIQSYAELPYLTPWFDAYSIRKALSQGKDTASALLTLEHVIQSGNAARIISAAREFIFHGYIQELVPFAQEILATHTFLLDNSDIQFLVAVVAAQTGRLNLLETLQKLPIAEPNSPEFSNIGELLLATGNFQTVIQLFSPLTSDQSPSKRLTGTRFVASAYFALKQPELVDSTIDHFLSSTQNTYYWKEAFKLLLKLGRTQRAHTLRDQIIERIHVSNQKLTDINDIEFQTDHTDPFLLRERITPILRSFYNDKNSLSKFLEVRDLIPYRSIILRAYELLPNAPNIRLLAALAMFQIGKIGEARNILRTIARNAKTAWDLALTIQQLSDRKLYGELTRVFLPEIGDTPLHPNSIQLIASAHFHLGNIEAATAQFQKYVDSLHDPVAGYTRVATLLNTFHDYNRATEWANKALRIDPNRRSALFELGISQLHLGNVSGADLIDRTLQDGFPGDYDRIIQATADTQDFNATSQRYAAFLDLDPNNPVLPLSHLATKHPKLVSSLLEAFRDAAYPSAPSNMLPSLAPLTQIYETMGATQTADLLNQQQLQFSYGLFLNSDFVNALSHFQFTANNYAYHLAEANTKTALAQDLSQRSIVVNVSTPLEASFTDTYGWSQFILGNSNEAANFIETATLLFANFPNTDSNFNRWELYRHLGIIHQRNGGSSFGVDSSWLLTISSLLKEE